MEIDTKYFGKLPYTAEEALLFEDGLFGFEDEKKFILIQFDKKDSNILCMQSAKTPSLAFVIMNPFFLLPDYNPILSKHELAILESPSNEALNFYVICTIREEIRKSTANFRSPIVVNPTTLKSKQFILDDTTYSFRHKFEKLTNTQAPSTRQQKTKKEG